MNLLTVIKNYFSEKGQQVNRRQLLAEFDTVKRRADFFQSIINNILENPDEILNRYAPYEGIELYRKMASSDPVIASAISTRKSAVLNRSWTIIDNGSDAKVRDYVRKLFDKISDFHQTLEDALEALVTGFVPLEIFWTVDNQFWYIDKIVGRDPADYCFDVNGNLRLLTRDNPSEGVITPKMKFIVHRNSGSASNPYGVSVLRSLYWPVTFSRAGWKWWATAIEKYGMPIITATFPESASSEEQAKFEQFVKSLQAYSWSVVPDGFLVDLHETKRASGDDYLPFLEYADTKKFQVILGQNLTSEVTSRGSRAQAEVHNYVRYDIILADAANLENTINSQLIAPAVRLNFGSVWPLPKFKITTSPSYDIEKLARTYDILSKHISISEKYLRDVFRIER